MLSAVHSVIITRLSVGLQQVRRYYLVLLKELAFPKHVLSERQAQRKHQNKNLFRFKWLVLTVELRNHYGFAVHSQPSLLVWHTEASLCLARMVRTHVAQRNKN